MTLGVIMSMSHKGLAKLIEECGEVIQVGGKVLQVGSIDSKHWSGVLRTMMEDEIADLQAAIEYVIEQNSLNKIKIGVRRARKLKKFKSWDKE